MCVHFLRVVGSLSDEGGGGGGGGLRRWCTNLTGSPGVPVSISLRRDVHVKDIFHVKLPKTVLTNWYLNECSLITSITGLITVALEQNINKTA